MPKKTRTRRNKPKKLTLKAMEDFCIVLSQTGSVTQAADHIGVSRPRLYEKKKEDPWFSEQWDEARERAGDALKTEARRRALGWDEERFDADGNVYTIRKYSDKMLELMLKAVYPYEFRDRVDPTANAQTIIIKTQGSDNDHSII